jgi:hypothetical protein
MTNTAPIELDQLFRFSRGLPHQIAAVTELQEAFKQPGATYATVMRRDQPWFKTWSTDGKQADPELVNLQSWLTFLCGPDVERISRGKIKPLTPAEACGFIGCIIVETGRPLLDKLDVVEAGSGAGRGAMQYTGVRRVAYDKAAAAAIAKGIDPNSNAWQQQYFAEEYAGLHDPPQGSLIGWTKVFEDRLSGMDPSRAAAYWTAHYFRPGVPHIERRQQEAQRVWELVQSKRLSVPAQRPPLHQTPVAPAGGLNPCGSEEAGMVGPAIKAPVKTGDSYLLVNDRDQDIEAYDHTGQLLWKAPCLARGQGADNDWRTRNSDTPPGLYKIGDIHRDYEQVGANPAFNATLRSYGWYSFDMIELENQEAKHGRAGIMLHGGGSACGWPGAWAPKQPLYSTHGCLRMHNTDLRDKVLPLTQKGAVYIGVHQERP